MELYSVPIILMTKLFVTILSLVCNVTIPFYDLYVLYSLSGLILGLRPANDRWHYFVTTSLIGWAQA